MQYFVRLATGLCGALFFLCVGAAGAEARRVALVIGNAAYKIGPLQNPVNDALAVAEALDKRLRFDKVILKRNLGFEAFRTALMELAAEAANADVALVYFAGHGTEVDGKNFLIPVDATLARASALGLEAIGLDTVLTQLNGARKLKVVILDACRNNPFAVAGGKRSVSRGLSRIEPEDNTLVAFAAKDGTTADDGPGRRHSPFTEALLKHIATPAVDVRFLFAYVRNDVMEMTNREQQPHLYGTLGPQYFFLNPQSGPAAPPGAQSEAAEIANKAKAEADAAKARAEAEVAKAEAARLKSKSEMERAKAEAERAAAELAKARAEADLARVRAQAEAARVQAEAEAARAQADKQKEAERHKEAERQREAERQKQALLQPPPRVQNTATLFNPAAKPSFKCPEYAATPFSSPHKTPQSDTLCIEPQAASADREMEVVYLESLRGLDAAARKAAVLRQREWILERNRRCPASWADLSLPDRRREIAECLIRETYARMQALRR